MAPVDPDIIAAARVFLKKHREHAPIKVREIGARHQDEGSEDTEFWEKVAEMVEALHYCVRSDPNSACPGAG